MGIIRLLSVALFIGFVGSAWTIQPTAQENSNPFTSRIDVRMGQRLFQAQCTTCHGLNATGGNEGVGPDLTTGQFRHADGRLCRVFPEGEEQVAGMGRD